MAIGIALRIHYFGGMEGSDDLSHAYGGYHFFSDFHKGFVNYHSGISRVRIGLDFLLWISFSLFGVHEWSAGLPPFIFSLLGTLVMYFLARRVAGETAGLVAAGFMTFLPVDVYLAGVWLQDVVLSTLIALSALLLMRSMEDNSPRAAAWWGTLSGVILGYASYVKDIAVIVVAGYLLWGLLIVGRNRRAVRVLWMLAGFVVFLSIVALGYWYPLTGDPFFNIRMLVAQHKLIQQRPASLFLMVFSFPYMVVRQLPFGPILVLTPLFLGVFAFSKQIRYRGLVLILFGLLWFSLFRVAQMGVQQRYLMLVVTPTIVIAAAALTVMTARLPLRIRSASLAIIVGLTLVGFAYCPQQFRWQAFEPVRNVHTILSLVAGPDEPVFADPRMLLVLYQLNGFSPYPGGLYRYPTRIPADREAKWNRAFAKAFDERYGVAPDGLELHQRQRGWVVYNQTTVDMFEKRKWRLPIRDTHEHPPANWTRVATYYQMPLGKEVSLFLIRPMPGVFNPLPLNEPPEHYRTPWDKGLAANVLSVSANGIASSALFSDSASASPQRYAGMRLPITSGRFHLKVLFQNAPNINAVYIYAGNKEEVKLAWRAAGEDLLSYKGSRLMEFSPDDSSDPFVMTRTAADPEIQWVDIFVSPARSGRVGFVVSDVEARGPGGGSND